LPSAGADTPRINNQPLESALNDLASFNHKRSALSGRALQWSGAALLLPVFYFLVVPWFVLFQVSCFPALNGDHPLAKAFELSMYSAIQLAEHSEWYGDYFWGVLTPLGG